MAHAIIRGKNGRRYEVEFDDAPVRVEVHASEETVEIFVEADFETHPEERRRFAIINIPRHLFSEVGRRDAQRRIVNAAAAHSVPLPSSGRRHRCLPRSGLVQNGLCGAWRYAEWCRLSAGFPRVSGSPRST